jgi:hypothetical protein
MKILSLLLVFILILGCLALAFMSTDSNAEETSDWERYEQNCKAQRRGEMKHVSPWACNLFFQEE